MFLKRKNKVFFFLLHFSFANLKRLMIILERGEWKTKREKSLTIPKTDHANRLLCSDF